MKALILLTAIVLCGCATASPIDPLIPFRSGRHYLTNYVDRVVPPVNGLYYSVSDMKLAPALIKMRSMELMGQKAMAQGESALFEPIAAKASDTSWALILGLTTGGGGIAGMLAGHAKGLKKVGPDQISRTEAAEKIKAAADADPKDAEKHILNVV